MKSSLFNLTVLDLPDQFELLIEAKYNALEVTLSKDVRSERIIHLIQLSSSATEKYADINDALLYGILVKEQQHSHESFQLLHSIIQDQWDHVCNQLKYFTFARHVQLQERVRERLYWLVEKLIALQARGVENLVIGLLRQIKGCAHRSQDNTRLIQYLQGVFVTQKSWLYQQPSLIPFILYSFMRLIAENGIDPSLRKDLVHICTILLQEKFKECAVIGRDLIRLLHDVSRLPDFEPVWRHLHTRLHDSEDSLVLGRILKVPTPRRFVTCRLTPEMEAQLLFMLESVKYGAHRRYQEWYAAEHFSERDSDALIVDVIRFLIVAYHPTNIVLASPSVQRWHAISWLLRLLKSSHSSANGKLALFYDWLFYDPNVDSIMNIEPAILIATKSVSKAPQITANLIEFLYLTRSAFCPPLARQMGTCLDRSMQDILTKRVINNLEGILLADGLSDQIKSMTRDLFPCYLAAVKGHASSMPTPNNSTETTSGSLEYHAPSALIQSIDYLRTATHDPRIDPSRLQDSIYEVFLEIAKQPLSVVESGPLNQSLSIFVNNCLIALLNDDSLRSMWQAPLGRVIARLSSFDLDAIDARFTCVSATKPFSLLKLFTQHTVSSLINSDDLKVTIDSPSLKSATSTESTSESLIAALESLKQSNMTEFYQSCLQKHVHLWRNSGQIMDALYFILDDIDSSQAYLLRMQILMAAEPILISSKTIHGLTAKLGDTVLWDGYMQIFLWDLLEVSLLLIDSPFELAIYLKSIATAAHGFYDHQKNAEFVSGIVKSFTSVWARLSQDLPADVLGYVADLSHESADFKQLFLVLLRLSPPSPAIQSLKADPLVQDLLQD